MRRCYGRTYRRGHTTLPEQVNCSKTLFRRSVQARARPLTRIDGKDPGKYAHTLPGPASDHRRPAIYWAGV